MIFSSIYSNSMKNNKNMYYRLCTYVCTLIYERNNFELIFHGVEGNSQWYCTLYENILYIGITC